jgi:hypothetical protein
MDSAKPRSGFSKTPGFGSETLLYYVTKNYSKSECALAHLVGRVQLLSHKNLNPNSVLNSFLLPYN